MSHNLVYNSITKQYEMMSRGATWHNLGQIVKDAQTAEETIKLAGLDWTVSKRNLKTPNGIEIPRVFGIFRDDKGTGLEGDTSTDEEGFLGVVGDKFHSIQNARAFQFADAMVQAEGGAHYEAAGALGKGEQTFILINLNESFEIVEGDRHENYFLFTNPHNSDASPMALVTSVRVICANTLRMALSQGTKNALKFRHTASVEQRLVEAETAIKETRQTVRELREKLVELSERVLVRETVESVLDRLFPKPKVTNELGNATAAGAFTRVENRRKQFLEIFEKNDGDGGFKAIAGTAYNALNAFTEMTDHYQTVVMTKAQDGRTVEEVRAARAMVGDGATEKMNALETILEATKFAPRRELSRTYSFAPVSSDASGYADGDGSLLDQILNAKNN